MHPTFLLSTCNGIIARIEIGDKNAVVVLQKLISNRCFSGFAEFKDDVFVSRESPHILCRSFDIDGSLVGVKKGRLKEVPNDAFFSLSICGTQCRNGKDRAI